MLFHWLHLPEIWTLLHAWKLWLGLGFCWGFCDYTALSLLVKLASIFWKLGFWVLQEDLVGLVRTRRLWIILHGEVLAWILMLMLLLYRYVCVENLIWHSQKLASSSSYWYHIYLNSSTEKFFFFFFWVSERRDGKQFYRLWKEALG